MHTLLVALAITAAVYTLAVALLFLVGRRTAAKEIALLIPNLLVLFKGLARDPRVPRRSKWLLAIGAVWIASPIDLIPEFIPVLGPLDDAVVAALILRHLLRMTGPDVVAEHWRGDPGTLTRLLRLSGQRPAEEPKWPRSTDPRGLPSSTTLRPCKASLENRRGLDRK